MIKIGKTLCFTGHRPDKIGGYNWNSSKRQTIMLTMYKEIDKLITELDLDTFIFGGAIGIDQMAFEVVKALSVKKHPTIRLIVAVPFSNQHIKWFSQSDVTRYSEQLDFAHKVVFVDELEEYKFDKVKVGDYHPAKMQLRNQYMVDNSDYVYAVWDGSSGGTGNCIKYAKSKNKEIFVLNPNKL